MANYLTEEHIVLLHAIVIKETGGADGVRDPHGIKALIHLPQQGFGGKELYSDIFGKAAVYTRGIIKGHPFIDGNKRTAMVVASVFLEENGFNISKKEGGIARFGIEIAENKFKIPEIAAWFKKNSKRNKNR